MAQRAAFGFGWRVKALPSDIKLPTMKGASNPIRLVPRKGQVGPSVRAVSIQKRNTSLLVLKQYEILPQQPHGFHGALRHARIELRVKLINKRHRLPELAQQPACRSTRTDLSDASVLVFSHAEFQSTQKIGTSRYQRIKSQGLYGDP